VEERFLAYPVGDQNYDAYQFLRNIFQNTTCMACIGLREGDRLLHIAAGVSAFLIMYLYPSFITYRPSELTEKH
jgi:hypothetical protein